MAIETPGITYVKPTVWNGLKEIKGHRNRNVDPYIESMDHGSPISIWNPGRLKRWGSVYETWGCLVFQLFEGTP